MREKLIKPGTRITEKFVSNIDDRNSTIISFNYDLIIDNALINKNKDNGINPLNYGFKVRNTLLELDPHVIPFELDPHYEKNTISIPLYKLHGSLNWVYCPVCDAIDIAKVKTSDFIYINKSQCPICDTEYQPLLITPTMVKKYDTRFIKQIWSSAEDCIRRADKLVFIGYSLSTSDYYIRYIINRARALHQQIETGQLKVDVVTNKKKSGQPETSETVKRYERFFGQEINFHTDGFEEYIKKNMTKH